MNETYPFVLPPLPYHYRALLPYIDYDTMRVHHDILFQGYITRLNNALKDYPKYHNWTLERLLIENSKLPASIQTTVYNNAGGAYNHAVYFDAMTPNYQNPSCFMMDMLTYSFGSYNQFVSNMLAQGLSVFGSGWAWLIIDRRGNLEIMTTKNQDTPLPLGVFPLLPLDVWEHAYFLQYKSARSDYINNWFRLINWNYIEERIRHRMQ